MAELNEAESTKDAKKTKKEKKMEEKAAKKAAKKAKKNHEADKPDAENDDSDSVSSKIVMVLVTILIIAIWLGIFAVFVKADVGGFGSTVLAPALKDVPVLSKILPDSGNITASESKETAGYTNLDDAVSRIKELEKQLDDANSKNQADAQTINDLNAQIQDLSTYKEDQAATVRLPLTLAIIQALMVEIRDEIYAIALGSISNIEDIPVKDIKYVQAKEVIHLRGSVIPIIRLDKMLDIEPKEQEPDHLTVVIVQKGDQQAGLVVDNLIGQQEIVIKSLGKYINGNKLISGATILGDGDVALILDVNTLM